MNIKILNDIAAKMVVAGKGILAADESTPTCTKRFDSINVDCTQETRNVYRDMLFTAPNLSDYISGVIMFDETFHQTTINDKSISFPKFLQSKNILPGIKVDKGVQQLALSDGETITIGLDDLDERVYKYSKLGAKFAKWRAVITIADVFPSAGCIDANAHSLARYAAICQRHNIVPIVEPEVLMNGNHSIDRSFDVSRETLNCVFKHLKKQKVYLGGIVLKPSMVISGSDFSDKPSYDDVAKMTVECLLETVPEEVPGIAFLSGGQTSFDATNHLNIMNKKYSEKLKWNLTFSYGRALQSDTLDAWSGENNNMMMAQNILINHALDNSQASLGTYNKES